MASHIDGRHSALSRTWTASMVSSCSLLWLDRIEVHWWEHIYVQSGSPTTARIRVSSYWLLDPSLSSCAGNWEYKALLQLMVQTVVCTHTCPHPPRPAEDCSGPTGNPTLLSTLETHSRNETDELYHITKNITSRTYLFKQQDTWKKTHFLLFSCCCCCCCLFLLFCFLLFSFFFFFLLEWSTKEDSWENRENITL